ncbi:protein-methionine-sulfoxide reductase catalytic subunit MsrP [Spartinivicinus poritis]|uniref:Protein-methionine-sulfoxide reductase catalytic subunit MsrP n=1 Tax=Spartinivicinus poritis TaxID=2994640 RepID=A0ABT5U9Z3_9GAMM|nr:protein-methionine-sulfoxide reductase catalytic subunit MsrP [Spartinivicinus sp. A2-2]MDE1463189.1 protein-methionine-sulfoxide reductase catalytic subunit MsrP [Spartinivicinus sp. A2-2]
MLIKKPSDIKSYEITPESAYFNRRQFMKRLGQAAMLTAGSGWLTACAEENGSAQAQSIAKAKPVSLVSTEGVKQYPAPKWLKEKFPGRKIWSDSTHEELTPYEDVTRYNNFYEFGTKKGDPAKHAGSLITDPWSVTIDGEVEKPGTYTLEDILKPHDFEERIYRLRCVEAWSMVVPWVGFQLGDLLKHFNPTSKAKYVAFTTLNDPEQMPGLKLPFSSIEWPYVEGLRIDEAMNPLTLIGVGLYGKTMPPQNGAPLRLVVPWKYGFKSIKSIIKISLVEKEPPTTWNKSAPNEYGFYSNVNPNVSHPRWSQKRERRLPSSLFNPNYVETQLFNGYAEQVAHLYKGMDLAKYY